MADEQNELDCDDDGIAELKAELEALKARIASRLNTRTPASPPDDVVEEIAQLVAGYVGLVSPSEGTYDLARRIAAIASIEHPRIEELERAAKATGSALDGFIRMIDRDDNGYKWARRPTYEEVQEAMRANNDLRKTLNASSSKENGNG